MQPLKSHVRVHVDLGDRVENCFQTREQNMGFSNPSQRVARSGTLLTMEIRYELINDTFLECSTHIPRRPHQESPCNA